MISKLMFNFGSTKNSQKLDYSPSSLTIFVGPNNSGKSRALSELSEFCTHGTIHQDFVILKNVEIPPVSMQEAESEFNRLKLFPNQNERINATEAIVGSIHNRARVSKEQFLESLTSRRVDHLIRWCCSWYICNLTLFLNGQNRMASILPQSAGDLLSAPQNSLAELFHNDIKRTKLSNILFDSFKYHILIDPTDLGHLRIRLSATTPPASITRSLTKEAIDFYKEHSIDISDMSDGIKAFTGIMLELIAGDPRIVIIDEPEAFLHPSLAYNLGKEISSNLSTQSKQVFISTHSSNFLMGCLQNCATLSIIRLTYQNGIGTARTLPSEKLLSLIKNPLLRSANVFSGLFYEAVIVTEGDADRAFYQEINERMLKYSPDRGIKNCLFLNAQNKQTIWQIIKPLRELGIPAAAIFDIDALKEGGTNWINLLSGGFIPDITIEALANSRSLIYNVFKDSGLDMKKSRGIYQLATDDQAASENLLAQLSEYGLFIVPQGELESWLPDLKVKSSHSPEWLIEAFTKMGENGDDPAYLKPSTGDVWDFISNIAKWLSNPNKKGIPQ